MNLDHATSGVAAAGVTSPLWLPSLHDISAACAEWLPILGMGWLAIRTGFFFYDRYVRNGAKRS